MPRVIPQQTIRRFFYACMALTLLVPLTLASTNFSGQLDYLSDCLRIAPGLDALASQSKFPNATAIGLGISAILGITTGVLTIFMKNENKTASAFFENYSVSQKVLHSLFGLIVVFFPFIIPTVGGSHQFSYKFFLLVANNPLVLGIFASFLYAYMAITLLFVFTIIFNKKMETK